MINYVDSNADIEAICTASETISWNSFFEMIQGFQVILLSTPLKS